MSVKNITADVIKDIRKEFEAEGFKDALTNLDIFESLIDSENNDMEMVTYAMISYVKGTIGTLPAMATLMQTSMRRLLKDATQNVKYTSIKPLMSIITSTDGFEPLMKALETAVIIVFSGTSNFDTLRTAESMSFIRTNFMALKLEFVLRLLLDLKKYYSIFDIDVSNYTDSLVDEVTKAIPWYEVL